MGKVGDIRVCALDGCGEEFKAVVHNQRFCSKNHCRLFTNKKILEQYHERKNRNMKNRVCSQKGCGTILSIYNNGTKCGVHERIDHISKLTRWGWQIGDDDI